RRPSALPTATCRLRGLLVRLHGRLPDPIPVDVDADAGPGGHGDRALRADVDAGLDEIGREVPAARGDVAGERKVRQRREMDVVRAADAALEHAAVPDRHAARGADV